MSDIKKGSSEDFENFKSEEFSVNNQSDINEKSTQNLRI